MYRFRVTYELSKQQIKKYIKIYQRKKDLPISLFLVLAMIVFLVLVIFFDIINTLLLKIIISIVIVLFFVSVYLLFNFIRFKILIKKPPFAIGPYITIEIRDGYFNVNCSGVMKGFPKGYLNGKINKKGDYILINKKDIIVIPSEVITPNIANELKTYFNLDK